MMMEKKKAEKSMGENCTLVVRVQLDIILVPMYMC